MLDQALRCLLHRGFKHQCALRRSSQVNPLGRADADMISYYMRPLGALENEGLTFATEVDGLTTFLRAKNISKERYSRHET